MADLTTSSLALVAIEVTPRVLNFHGECSLKTRVLNDPSFSYLLGHPWGEIPHKMRDLRTSGYR